MELRENIFNATPSSTWQVLCSPGVGFYIPPYQRGYDWDDTHIDRLFEDFGHGLRLLLKNEDSITFLGTLIVIDKDELPDANQEALPNKIRFVIDGQQRLTTVLLMNICLHDEIRRRGDKFKEKDGDASKWLYNQTIQVTAQLQKTFEEDMNYGDPGYQWYPRIIRAYDDSWSRWEDDAKYESPVAAFVHGYSNHIRGDDQTKQYTANLSENDADKRLLRNYDVIRRNLRTMADESNTNLEMPFLTEVAESPKFQSVILRAKFPPEVLPILSDGRNEDFRQLIRLVLLANFLMNRVQVVVVSASQEEYAFDMFESLNTTGEPLTAFETFRPRVIEIEGVTGYEKSPSRKFLKPIENYLRKFNKAEDRHTETSRFLIPFALAETGYKLSKRHSEQRWYLRDQYDKHDIPQERHKFLEHMSHTAIFIEDTWKKGKGAFEFIEFSNKDVVLTCMDLLGKVSHEIAIGSLVRFYSQVQLTSPNDREAAVLELEGAIKAVTAFFAFWRGSGKTTGSLAAQYRELMGKGFDKLGNQAFCRCPEGREPLTVLTADKLRKALRYVLEDRGGISSTDDWMRLSFEQPIYKDRKTLTRFLLFAAMQDTSEDNENPGLRCPGREGLLDMFTWDKWDSNLTIEHVAPQSPEGNGWNDSLYERPDLLDYLGNLTLLPDVKNSSFGNRSWRAKKTMFYILAAPTPEEQKTRLAAARKEGIELADSTENILQAGKYFHHLSAIPGVEEWTAKFVRKRSKRLAKLVWTNIAPWLGFDDE